MLDAFFYKFIVSDIDWIEFYSRGNYENQDWLQLSKVRTP